MEAEVKFIFDEEHYEVLINKVLLKAKKYVWLTTANVKNMYIGKEKDWFSFIDVLEELVKKRVNIVIVHAGKPSDSFLNKIEKISRSRYFSLFQCQRNHQKIVVSDDEVAYLGSANVTGAGIGGKKEDRRNFEAGVITIDKNVISMLKDRINRIISYQVCPQCHYRKECINGHTIR
jgi:phosphatidylserine/phosphatidylglycerophosphate/cardiolipin synthase-like enzyme